MSSRSHSRARRWRVPALILLAALLVGAFIGLRPYFRQDLVRRLLAEAGFWAPFLYIAVYIVAPVLFLPGSVITLAGGAAFGPLWGTVYTIIGATLGASVSFLLARYLVRDFAERKAGRILATINRGIERDGWKYLAITRLIPLFPFNILNYAYGMTTIRLRTYILVSFVTMLPGTFAYVYLGYAARTAVSGAGDFRRTALVISTAVGLVLLLSLVGKRFASRYKEQAES